MQIKMSIGISLTMHFPLQAAITLEQYPERSKANNSTEDKLDQLNP